MSFMRIVTFIISVFIVGMVEMMVAGIMNLMSHDLHVSEAWIGQLVTLYAVTFAVCGPILVKLTNRFNAKSVLLWTIVAFVAGNAMIVVSPNFAVLIIGRIISSAAAALIIVKVLALTAMLTAPEHRGKMIGIVYSGFSGANVLGVPIGTILGGWLGWRATFVFIIVISVLAAILMIRYLPTASELSFVSEGQESGQTPQSKILNRKEVIKYLTITFLLLTANSITFVYINPLMLSNGHDLKFVSFVLLINGIAGTLGTSMGGFLADKWSSKTWLLTATLTFAVALAVINWFLSASWMLIIIIFIWNVMQWSTNPAVQSGIIEHVQGDASQVLSWNMSSLNAGIAAGGMLGGLIVSHLGVNAVTYSSSILGFIIVIIILFLKKVRHTPVQNAVNTKSA
ncbi:MFS transporter [Staphylococcus condimenti]|uniref:MFS transporter n=1 Tax=Staphylococcus condimenti TaxID=70255 RepID=A0A143PCP0_9STAP|nr:MULTISPECIES: MFS transporter [Staphylococcus]AMY06322.1 chloramphenicol resistance protein [Staphylococcus condimenti]APR60205.1 chloramphenicol resistance protein [Staphylococcus condimenti]MDK8644339.1 MFS transporter [Staphylococcus condimenti]OFP00166.1 chloramphenicol resistance protein [Staphylococcus sp. HMSC065E08]PNZ60476.1 MFS transporter [Staphylococcus condimenti]